MMKMIAHIHTYTVSLNDYPDVAFEFVVLSSLIAARYMVGILAVSPRDLFLAQISIGHLQSLTDWAVNL